MKEYVFPISGAHGACCVGNVRSALNIANEPTFFKFHTIDLSPNYRDLIVTIDDDVTTEEEVRRYIHQAFEDTIYSLIKESARQYWQKAALGLSVGSLLLVACLVAGTLPLPIMVMMAMLSLGLTGLLGMGSLRNAIGELKRREPGMDTLFSISTTAAMAMSLMAFFVPGFPMMFEVSLLIFGFRHLGIAIKKSIYESADIKVHYQRLSAQTAMKKTPLLSTSRSHNPANKSWEGDIVDWEEEPVDISALVPGDILKIASGETIPLNGWLLPESDSNQSYWMDVSRIEGTLIPKELMADDVVLSGMVATTPCMIRVGLGYVCEFYAQKPENQDPKNGKLWVYLDDDHVMVRVRSDHSKQLTTFALQKQDLIDSHGHDHRHDILNALRLQTVSTHLPKAAYQQLMRGIVARAPHQALSKTASFLQRLEEDLVQSSLTRAPIQEWTKTVLKYFVPLVIGIAVVSGLIAAYFFSPLIALRCVIAILVSACPCTVGFNTPLVLDFSRDKGRSFGIIFNHADAIQCLTEIDTVALDIHGTSTKGPTAKIEINPAEDESVVKTYLAMLQQHSDHPLGKAIYAAIDGDRWLQDRAVLDAKAICKEQGGIGAWMNGKYYLLGNRNLLRAHGFPPKQDAPGLTHFGVCANGTYTELATISTHDPLRDDTAEMAKQLKQRGLNVILLSGADQVTADAYAHDIGNIDTVIAGCLPADKVNAIQNLQAQGQKVLMVGDGVNDAGAIDVAYASMAIKHAASDEGIQYKAKVRILNQKMLSIVDAIDIAHQAMWTINVNLILSLIYNLLAVMLTNILLLAFGVVLYPGIGAALMVLQVGLIIMHAYAFKHKPLPSNALVLSREGIYAAPMSKTGIAMPENAYISAPT